MRVAVVGPLCRDIEILHGMATEKPGGVTYFTGTALLSLGVESTVYGSMGFDFVPALPFLMQMIRREKTVTFTNTCPEENPDIRIQQAVVTSQHIGMQDVLGIEKHDYVILGPLFHGDIDDELITRLPKKTKVALAAQGLIRYLDGKGIVWKEPANVTSLLPYIDYLFLDGRELAFITGDDDVDRAGRALLAYGPREVCVTLGSEGSILFSGTGNHRIRAFPVRGTAYPTGAGDSYLAGYVKALEMFDNPCERGEFAAMTATMAIETGGPFRGTVDDVFRRLEEERSEEKR